MRDSMNWQNGKIMVVVVVVVASYIEAHRSDADEKKNAQIQDIHQDNYGGCQTVPHD